MHQGEAKEQHEPKKMPEPTRTTTSASVARKQRPKAHPIQETVNDEPAYLRPDVDGLVVPGEDTEDGIEDGPLGAVVVEDERVLLHVVRQLVVADQGVLLPLPALTFPLPPPLLASSFSASLHGRRRLVLRTQSHGTFRALHGHGLSLRDPLPLPQLPHSFSLSSRIMNYHGARKGF
jgi:hypothetical protein